MNLESAVGLKHRVSKRWFTAYYFVSVAFLTLTLVDGEWAFTHSLSFVLSIFFLNVGLFILKILGEKNYEQGEFFRRLLMWNRGLGIPLTLLQKAKIAREVGCGPSNVEGYYEKGARIGPRRLIQITSESAFFTSDLAKATAAWLLALILLGCAAVIVSLLYFLKDGTTAEISFRLSRIFMSAISVFITGDAASTYLRFRELGFTAEDTLRSCDDALKRGDELKTEEAFLIAVEYNSALSRALPIPRFVYWLRRDHLNNSWSAKKAAV